MHTKRGGVAAYHIVWLDFCLRRVPGVRVLASAVHSIHLLTAIGLTPGGCSAVRSWNPRRGRTSVMGLNQLPVRWVPLSGAERPRC